MTPIQCFQAFLNFRDRLRSPSHASGCLGQGQQHTHDWSASKTMGWALPAFFAKKGVLSCFSLLTPNTDFQVLLNCHWCSSVRCHHIWNDWGRRGRKGRGWTGSDTTQVWFCNQARNKISIAYKTQHKQVSACTGLWSWLNDLQARTKKDDTEGWRSLMATSKKQQSEGRIDVSE